MDQLQEDYNTTDIDATNSALVLQCVCVCVCGINCLSQLTASHS